MAICPMAYKLHTMSDDEIRLCWEALGDEDWGGQMWGNGYSMDDWCEAVYITMCARGIPRIKEAI